MSGDRRRWFRCIVLEGNDQALLRAGEQESVVRLTNTSAGGFAAICQDPLDVELGELLLMRTTVGWIEVRVVRLQVQGDRTHVGLERVRELGDRLKRSWLDMVGGRAGALMLAGALVVGLVLGASAVGIVPMLRRQPTDEAAAPMESAPQIRR